MAKKQTSLTSITETVAHNFLKNANDRDTLTCDRIPGFTLIRLGKGGSWRWRYTNAAGKRRVATVGSYATKKPEQAAQIVLEWINNKADPLEAKGVQRHKAQAAASDAARRTLRNYLDTVYLPHMERSWKAKNATLTYNRITGHFEFLLDRDMATISKTDIDDWQREEEAAKKAYSTIRRTFGSLKTLLRQAVKDGFIVSDPLATYRLLEPTIKDQRIVLEDEGKEKRRMFTPEEVQGILKGLDLFSEEKRAQRRNSRSHGKPELRDLDTVHYPHWFIPFCHMFWHTGLRPGDLYSLTWQELNIKFGRLKKICEKTSHAVRREKKPAVVDQRLNETILQIMKDWNDDQGKPTTGLVFPSVKTGEQFDPQAHSRPWARVKKLGGIAAELDLYSFRHNFISAMLAAGVPIFTVAKLVGQKSVEMIQDRYGHLCPDQATIALNIVAKAIEREQTNSGATA